VGELVKLFDEQAKKARERKKKENCNFSFYNAPIRNKYSSKEINVEELVNILKSTKYKSNIDIIKAEPDKDKRRALKSKLLDYVTIGGSFKERNKKKLINCSGLCCVDVDGLDDVGYVLNNIRKDKFTRAVFISPSYTGLKVIFAYDVKDDTPEGYENMFLRYCQYIETRGIPAPKIDKPTKDVSRACFMSYDPNTYYNPNSEMFIDEELKEEPTKEKVFQKKEKVETTKKMIPYCVVIEKHLSVGKAFPSDGKSRHAYIDAPTKVYCEHNNKPQVLEGYSKSQGRDSSAFNDWKDWDASKGICGNIITYLVGNKGNTLVDAALKDCEKCKYNNSCGEITLPVLGKLNSEFTKEICEFLVDNGVELFFKPNEQEITEIILIENGKEDKPKYLGFKTITPHRFINIAEEKINTGLIIPKEDKKTKEIIWEFKKKTMTSEVAKISLCNDVWKNSLRHIERILTAPIPILYEGKLAFPEQGHDKRFNSWLPEGTPKIDKDLTIKKAKETINKIYSEFCFKDVQSKVNAVSQLIGQFCQGLYKSFSTRTPITFWEGNRERTGKDYGGTIPGLVFEGFAVQDTPISTNVKNSNSSEELRKKITTMLKTGRRRFHSANNKGFINNEVFEALATLEVWADRLLGVNTEIKIENEMFLSMSANIGYTAPADFVNRCRFVRLHLDIEDANKRHFNNPLLHQWILQNRGLILSSLYAFVREWHKADMPKGKTLFSSFPDWANIVGGVMVFNELGDPCVADEFDTGITGDKETNNMKSFFEYVYDRFPEEYKTKKELINFIIESDNLELFGNLKLEERSGQIKFAFLLEKYVGRILSDIRLTKDNSIKRTARQPYKFTKGENVKETQDKLGGKVGNDGNEPHTPYIGGKNINNNMGDSETLPTLPTLPQTEDIEEEPIFQPIHQRCSVCNALESHTETKEGKPICETCFKQKEANKGLKTS